MARYRAFRDFVADDGANTVRAWLDALPVRAKRKINVFIERLEVVDQLEMPTVRVLKGSCDGLMELRVKSENVQYRPLCCYGPGQGEVTILFGATERGGRFQPPTACATALARKTRLGERGRTCDHDFG
jgi:hypothetical protein